MIVVLDSGPLGLLLQGNVADAVVRCQSWFDELIVAGVVVALPEIIDYEIRRELLRLRFSSIIDRLDRFPGTPGVRYVPLMTEALLLAAEFWAETRQAGRSTAHFKAIDIDVILAAQARLISVSEDVVVAPTNISHLARFVPARLWQDIAPR